MIGFVSALSSSLAIIILIMSVMMLNMMQGAENEKDQIQSQLMMEAEEAEEQKKKDNNKKAKQEDENKLELNNNVVSEYYIKKINKMKDVKMLTVYCEYGTTLDYTVASKFTTFNAIVLAKKFSQYKLNVQEPLLQQSTDNKCFIINEK